MLPSICLIIWHTILKGNYSNPNMVQNTVFPSIQCFSADYYFRVRQIPRIHFDPSSRPPFSCHFHFRQSHPAVPDRPMKTENELNLKKLPKIFKINLPLSYIFEWHLWPFLAHPMPFPIYLTKLFYALFLPLPILHWPLGTVNLPNSFRLYQNVPSGFL
jgi:hypothetical protein